jgi:hypothetical protein
MGLREACQVLRFVCHAWVIKIRHVRDAHSRPGSNKAWKMMHRVLLRPYGGALTKGKVSDPVYWKIA